MRHLLITLLVVGVTAPAWAQTDPAQAAPLYIRDKVALSIVERAERKQAALDDASGQRTG